MLILVAVTITVAVNGGLFEHAGQAVKETQDAINAEQTLASGKIKIDGKWYASIEDYLNDNPITTGIEIDTTTINLKKKETTEVEGEEILTGTITASTFGMEKEPEITWEVTPEDQTAVTLSETTGKTVTVTAVGTANATVTVMAKCIYEGVTYSETCEVTLKILKPINVAKGSFVEYGVAYTDAYIAKEYTTTNGWRLLDYTNNGDGTISNVKLISTGIPAKLYYAWSDSSTNKSWWVTTESSEAPTVPNLTDFREVLGGADYTFYTGESTYYALQASAGMYYNFGDIKFAYSSTDRGNNLGYFTSITTGGATYDANNNNTAEKTGNDLFKVRNDVTSVRLLTLKEVNEALGRSDIDSKDTIMTDSIGLYRLDQLKNVTGMSTYNYDYSSNGSIVSYYWLASPFPSTSDCNGVCIVIYAGYMNSSVNATGVRPVVSLGSNIRYTVDSETDSSGITYLTLTAE